MATYEARLKKWQTAAADARKAGKPVPQRPRNPRNPLTASIGPVIFTTACSSLSPARYRSYLVSARVQRPGKGFRDVFPLMIQNWRDEWGQGDFPLLGSTC